MKLFVKTLNGLQYEIECQPQDTVGDLKKKIESVVGADVYPAARQIVIHQENVLMDCTTLDGIELTKNMSILVMLLPEAEKSTASASAATPVSASKVPQVQPTLAPLESDFCSQDASNLIAGINLVDTFGDSMANLCDSQSKYLNYLDELGDKFADSFDLEDQERDLTSDFSDSHPAPQNNNSHADSNMVSGNNSEEVPVVDSTTGSGDSTTISDDSLPKPEAFSIEDFFSPEYCMVELDKYMKTQRFKDLVDYLQSMPE